MGMAYEYAAWDAEDRARRDALRSLLACLRRGENPPLPWVLEMSAGGKDPVHVAWEACNHPWDRMALMTWYDPGQYGWETRTVRKALAVEYIGGHSTMYVDVHRVHVAGKALGSATPLEPRPWARLEAAITRELARVTPPTLPEVLAVLRARRSADA